MAKVLNTSPGLRGAYLKGALIMVPPGGEQEADDFCEEWFKLVEGGSGETGALGALTVPQLKQVAVDEEVDLGEATKKADIIAVIEEARAAKDADNE